MTFEDKCKLVMIHGALDESLGDSDPMDDITDDEMREQYPGVWAASHLADVIGPAPWDKYLGPCEETWKERAKVEKAELDERISKLEALMTDQARWDAVEFRQRILLRVQLRAMESYREALRTRLECINAAL